MAAEDQRAKFLETVAPIVQRLQEEKGWSNRELARQAGTSKATINRLLNRENVPAADVLFRIADAFGVTSDELRGRPAPKRKSTVKKIPVPAA